MKTSMLSEVEAVTRKVLPTILLVDDDLLVRSYARFVLAKQGYPVLEAKDAEEALIQLAKNPDQVGFVISDMMMSGMNGRELADFLEEVYPEVKVLIMSGGTDDTELHLRIASGKVAFIQKPFEKIEFLLAVRRLIGD